MEGILPESLCQIKELKLLELTSMGGGKSCRDDTFKDTFLENYFNGFTTTKYLKGTIPDCIWSLPNLATLYAGGNRICGQIPEVLGPQLMNLSLPFNYLNGTLPSALVTNPSISTVSLQHNRLTGDLGAFSHVSHLEHFNATVNSLSGTIPKSLLGLADIDILRGNVFGCHLSGRDLPSSDPSSDKYQCGSNLYNISLYTFLVFFVICLAVIWHSSILSQYFRELQLWRDVTRGKKWRNVNIGVSLTAVRKYAFHLFDIRWSMLQTSIGLLIALVTYFSLWKSRLIEYRYGWISTAAYVTGSGAAITLGCVYYVIIFIITLICYKDETEELLVTKKGDEKSGEEKTEETKEYTSREYAAFAGRMICLGTFIWGFLIAGNALYLHILLHFSITSQDIFRYFFALFKWVWINVVTYSLFEMDVLTFGVPRDKHLRLIEKYCGSRLGFIFMMNAVSLFFVPIITQMIVDPACFHNYFISESINTFTSVKAPHCSNPLFVTAKECELAGWEMVVTHSTYEIEADIPFVYNYTCSSAIIRAYVPLYANMYTLILVSCLFQYIYLMKLAKQDIDTMSASTVVVANESNSPVGWLKYYLLMAFPAYNLLWDSHQRKQLLGLELSDDSNVFPGNSKLWLWRTLPDQLSTLLVSLTFGTLAPLLGLMLIITLFTEVYIVDLVLGRFLVREINVIVYSKRNEPMVDALKYERVPISNDPKIHKQAEDAAEHWGAMAAIKELAKLCEDVPLTIFSSSRVALIFLTTSVLSFLLNDVVNSSGNPYEPVKWPSAVLMLCPFVSIFVVKRYHKRKYGGHQKRKGDAEQEQGDVKVSDGMELNDIFPTNTKPEETHNPIRI
eukprot:GSChrysophyteH1.ASY1.ANO1.2984.1 assembled CDS